MPTPETAGAAIASRFHHPVAARGDCVDGVSFVTLA
jgi:hypothetical protein